MVLKPALVSFALVCAYVASFPTWLFKLLVFYKDVILFSFGCFEPAKRLPRKIG